MHIRLLAPGTASDEVRTVYEQPLRGFLERYAPLPVVKQRHQISVELVRCSGNLSNQITVESLDLHLSQVGQDAITYAMGAATEALNQKYFYLAPKQKAAAKVA